LAKVDLLLPTYRWGPYVRGYIRYLASIIEDGSDDLCLHIGDNSCNPAKHAFLTELKSPRVKLHLHSANVGMHPNAMHLLECSDGEFVQFLGDDDWIHPTCFAHAGFLQRNAQCSACAGFFAGIPPMGDGGLACLNDRFMVSDPVGRSIDYVQYLLWEAGVNWLALAMHRRSTMSVYAEYTRRHPFQFYFRDQVLSQIALLTGPVKGLRDGFMFYNNRRPEEIPAHLQGFRNSLEDMGLAPWLLDYYYYLLACEYAALYLYRGLADSLFSNRIADANRVFMKLFERYYNNTYRENIGAYEEHFINAGIEEPMHAVLEEPSAIVGLKSMLRIFTTINADAGKRYADFLRREIVVDLGE